MPSPITIQISGVIGWDVTGQQVREALAEAGGKPIRAEFATAGGLAFDGLEIYSLFANYPGEKTAHIIGLAASMGSYLLTAFDRVTGEPNAVVMNHNAWGGAVGDHNAMRKAADVWEGMSNILATAYAKKTGKPIEEIKADMNDEKWLYGQEAVEYGMVDEIVDSGSAAVGDGVKAQALMDARVKLGAAQKLVAEYEGGDSLQRVAALVTVMQPRAEKRPAVSVAAGTPASKPKGSITKMTTLEELKAENPGLYALAESQFTAKGAQAERDRVSRINAFAANGPAAAKVAAEAVAAGKTFDEAMPELVAASARPASTQENAPLVATSGAQAASMEVKGMTSEDVKALLANGMTIEEIRANAPKGV